jgi:hypothetical protein
MQSRSFPTSCDLARRSLSLLLAGALLFAPLSSHAQAGAGAATEPSVAAESSAKTRFADALKLYKSGSVAEALPLFRGVAEATRSPNAQLYVAYCLAQLGKRADAHRAFALVLKQIAERPADKYDSTREAAEAQLAILNVRLSKIVILIPDAPPGVAVTLDGVAVEDKTLGSSIVVEPGTHHVEASASGLLPVRRDVSLDGGELKTIPLSLQKAAQEQPRPRPAPPVVAASPASAPRAPESHPIRTAGYVSGAVGVAGLAVFGVTGMMAKATFDRLDRECGRAGCSDAGHLGDINRGKSLQAIANIGLVVGAVGIAVGGTMIMVGGGKSKEARARVWVSPGVGMVSCGGTF